MGRKRKHNSPTTKGETMAREQLPQLRKEIMTKKTEQSFSMEVKDLRARNLGALNGLAFDAHFRFRGDLSKDYDWRSICMERIRGCQEFKQFNNTMELCRQKLQKHDRARLTASEADKRIEDAQITGEVVSVDELLNLKRASEQDASVAWDEFTALRRIAESQQKSLIQQASIIVQSVKTEMLSKLKKDTETLTKQLQDTASEILEKLACCTNAKYWNCHPDNKISDEMILASLGVPTDPKQPLFCTQGTGGVQPPPSNGGVGGIIGTTMVYRG